MGELEPSLERDITSLLNRYSAESVSDTPDFVLAEFLLGSIKVFNESIHSREMWYGRKCGGGSAING